jgi:histidinol-phosphate aminotransferase
MLVNENLRGKTQYVLPYTSKYRHKLDVIENFYPHHPNVLEVVSSFHEYPYHDAERELLIGGIAAYVGANASNIILTHGSDNALMLLIQTYVTPVAKIAIPVPTYPHFVSFIETTYNGGVVCPRVTTASDLIGMNFKDINVCYLVSPNLPLGYNISLKVVETLAKTYPSTLFIVDEAYHEYGGKESKARLAITLTNVIVVRTFSKAFGLAGLRIGYIVATAENVETISILVNEKNVTQLAVSAAVQVLRHIDYYLANAADVETMKHWLRKEINSIVAVDAPIFSLHLAAGNFFLLLCADPAMVRRVFAEHHILIRNKDADVRGAVRICMGPKDIMEDVLNVIRYINIGVLLKRNHVIFDLDMTLRDGVTANSTIYEGAIIVEKLSAQIATNNSLPPAVVVNYLANHDINIPISKVVTSLTSARKYLIQGGHRVYVYGRIEQKEYLADLRSSLEEATCILLCHIDISIRDIVEICMQLGLGKKLIYTDNSLQCSIDKTIEFGSDYKSELNVPDMGSLINMIKTAGYSATLVGKPNLPVCGDIVVGDSDVDHKLAQKIGAIFIKIDPDATPGYNFNKDYFVFNSVAELNRAYTKN